MNDQRKMRLCTGMRRGKGRKDERIRWDARTLVESLPFPPSVARRRMGYSWVSPSPGVDVGAGPSSP